MVGLALPECADGFTPGSATRSSPTGTAALLWLESGGETSYDRRVWKCGSRAAGLAWERCPALSRVVPGRNCSGRLGTLWESVGLHGGDSENCAGAPKDTSAEDQLRDPRAADTCDEKDDELLVVAGSGDADGYAETCSMVTAAQSVPLEGGALALPPRAAVVPLEPGEVLPCRCVGGF
jgi:hypothetical protein